MSLPRFPSLPRDPAVRAAMDETRERIRAFVREHVPAIPPEIRARTWQASDRDFSRKLGEAGFIGMTWPQQWGGGATHSLQRYVVLEELLAAGAPVGYHWVADRQSGPVLLRYGTEEQKADILPRIIKGEVGFCIGLSEPQAGSDLSSIATRAQPVPGGGWRLNGRKIWTSGAHIANYMIALVRTEGTPADRHRGLSQFLIDMRTPGVEPTPIQTLDGDAHFNEVLFDDAMLPEDALIGQAGNGWAQAMGELAYERSGPERFLSLMPLLGSAVALASSSDDARMQQQLGEMLAQLTSLRAMSLGVAVMLAEGEDSGLHAAMVKELGARFEQAIPQIVAGWLPMQATQVPASSGDAEEGSLARDYQEMLRWSVQNAPSFSIRGGTREILRGITARGLGLR